MFVFVLYAVLVWYLAARWRRRWEGFASVFAGLAGLILVAWLHILLYRWTNGLIGLPVLQILLYPYIVLVFSIGLFTACLPRSALPGHCPLCHYDLSGLEEETTVCPECGHDATAPLPTLADVEPAQDVPVVIPRAVPDGSTLEALARSRRAREQEPASRQSPATAARRAGLRSEER